MYNKKKELNPKSLNGQIDSILAQMDLVEGNSEAYSQLADQLEKLYKMKNLKKENRPGADALVAAGVNITGILLILHFEKFDVVTSKALGFITKIKL